MALTASCPSEVKRRAQERPRRHLDRTELDHASIEHIGAGIGGTLPRPPIDLSPYPDGSAQGPGDIEEGSSLAGTGSDHASAGFYGIFAQLAGHGRAQIAERSLELLAAREGELSRHAQKTIDSCPAPAHLLPMKTERKRSLTLNLSDEEMALLAALADRYGMSKSALIRQAIRAYAATVTTREEPR